MVQIRKKSGAVQAFDGGKIISAIKKSADRVNVEMSSLKNNKVVELVLDRIRDLEVVDVKDLHKMVELALDEVDKRVAKSYRDYRNYKMEFVKMFDEVYKKKLDLCNIRDNSNANADSSLVTTQKAITYSSLNSELYKKFFLTDEEEKAMSEGYIYIHDRGARLDSHNCLRRNTRFITIEGIKSFDDFEEGDEIIALSHKGIFRKAKVIRRPNSSMHRVVLVRGDQRAEVDCTLNHRWLLKGGSETVAVKPGDVLVDTPDMKPSESIANNWKVVDTIPIDCNEDVWCLDVEVDHSFMLEKGIPTGNCMLLNLKDILTGGFRMGNINYKEPKTVGTAITLMTDIMLNAGASQYGGITCSEIDKVLAPYAEYSYNRYRQEYLSIRGGEYTEEASQYAWEKTRKEAEDGAVEVSCRFNSTTTARGDYPFTSISFGLSDSKFGQLITSAFLRVRRLGLGTKDGIPVLFPKLTFMYDENLHGEGKPLEWLFMEAVDCTMRAQYPDFLSMTGDGYAPSIYKKYGVTISRMGCVEGKSQVIYRDTFGDIHECFIEEMWEYLSKSFPVLSQESLGYSSGYYMDLYGIHILDKNGFVNCSRIIRNTQNPHWYKVKLSGGKSLFCTADHPWTTQFGKVSHVTQTKDLIAGDVVEVFDGLPEYTEDNEIKNESVSVHTEEIVSNDEIDKIGYSYDVTTDSEHFYCSGIRSHNCRANLSPWYERGGMEPADENDKPVYEGRLNLGAISLHFPMLVAKAKEECKDFFEVLEYYLQLCRKIHLRTIEYYSHKKAGIDPLAYCEGGAYKGHKDPNEELGMDFLKPFTVSFGITALNEATVMYKGKTIYEDHSDFASKILQYVNDFADKYKKIDGVLYAIYSTPAESLSSLQVKQFRKKYGIIKGVSDREYMTNSFHMHVSEDITPIEKQDAEYKCFHLSNGGNIMYNRFNSDYNKEAFITLIRRAMKLGYYYGCNMQKDFCDHCGAEFMDTDVCPKCGSTDIIQIDRICGYLGFTKIHGYSMMNDGKVAEIHDRKCM